MISSDIELRAECERLSVLYDTALLQIEILRADQDRLISELEKIKFELQRNAPWVLKWTA